jgi:hypothetical protein
MKKLSAILVGMSLVAGAVMAAGPVTSVNAVGYQSINLTTGFKLITCPFMDVSTAGNMSIDSIFGTNMPENTTIFRFINNAYVTFTYDPLSGWLDDNYVVAGTNQLIQGEGVWIQVPTNCTLTMSGGVPGSNVQTNRIVLKEGFQILGFGYPVTLSATNAISNPLENDTIFKYVSGTYVTYTYDPLSGWLDDSYVVVDVPLNMGEGFWYQRQFGSGSNTWAQVKPYVWP